jgi:hypothetical protein
MSVLTSILGRSVRRRRPPRGQTLVEFALLLPMLLVLFLGVADFGRVFHAGIVVEAAARNAAEVVAEEYRRNPPGPLSDPAPPGDPTYYQPLHDLGARIVCEELRTLPSTTYNPATRECHVNDGDPTTYDWMPVILVCVHDEEDPLCPTPAFGATIPDPECSALLEPIGPAMEGTDAGEDSRYVEVRVCYRFTTLVSLPILSIGDVWLQKDRTFTVADYPLPTPSIPPPASAPPAEELPTEAPTPTPSASESPSTSPSSEPTAEPAPTPAEATPVPTLEPSPSPTAVPVEPTANPNVTPTPAAAP